MKLTTVFSKLWWENICCIREMMTHYKTAALPLRAIFELQREINSEVKWRSIQCTYHYVSTGAMLGYCSVNSILWKGRTAWRKMGFVWPISACCSENHFKITCFCLCYFTSLHQGLGWRQPCCWWWVSLIQKVLPLRSWSWLWVSLDLPFQVKPYSTSTLPLTC